VKKGDTIAFAKMSGSGNDFVVFDNRRHRIAGDIGGFARRVCERRLGVGADGLILLDKDRESDFRMAYYNRDGSRAEMCGNGGRCVALFACARGIAGNRMRFRTDDGVHSALVKTDGVKLEMMEPRGLDLDVRLGLKERELTAAFIDTGVPHVVVAVDDAEKVDVLGLGREIRNLPGFQPEGANADFAQLLGDGRVKVRTYERGVEGETLSCGTGCVAAAVVMGLRRSVSSPVTCVTASGETLKVYYRKKSQSIEGVFLEGGASIVYEGRLPLSEFQPRRY
jgi:diaminopimelate epimerase